MPGDRGEGERRGEPVPTRVAVPTSSRSMAMIDAMPRVSSPVFVGRAAELDRLCQALDRARDRRPSVVLIAGEAGIGKTRLVTEFSARAREGAARVLIGGSMQVGETGLPYAPVVGALRPLLRSLSRERLDELLGPGRAELAHLVPDLAPVRDRSGGTDGVVTSAAYQARLFEVLLELLRRLAEERPARARARGHPLGRCRQPRPPALPGPQRARGAAARARHVSLRRAPSASCPPPVARRAPAHRADRRLRARRLRGR